MSEIFATQYAPIPPQPVKTPTPGQPERVAA